MENNNAYKKKASVISAIMSSPSLSKELMDAINSPVGSTKRERAAAIFNSLHKTNKNSFDGKGGMAETSKLSPPVISPKIAQSTPSMLLNDTNQDLPTVMFPSAPERRFIGPTQDSTKPFTGEITTPTTPTTSSGNKETLASITKALDAARAKVPFIGPAYDPKLADKDYYETWYNKLSEAEKTKYKPVYEAYKAGVGPNTFAINSLGNKDALKSLFPGVPDEYLPTGSSLVGQNNQLENNLKEEFKLDELQKNLLSKQSEGIDLSENLSDYITTRDKNIENLDKMIGTARLSMLGSNAADPETSKRLSNYMNYLYVMKGRQQKRYADFLNTGITQYNKELSFAKDAYDSAYSKFSSLLKDKTDLNTERYGVMKDLLKEMYSNLENREKKAYEVDILKEKVAQEKYKSAKDALDALDKSGLTEDQKTKSQANYLDENKKATMADWNALSPEDKLRYLTKDIVKEKTITQDKREAIGMTEMMIKKNSPLSEIKDTVGALGYTDDEDLKKMIKEYEDSLGTTDDTKWYESGLLKWLSDNGPDIASKIILR